MRGMVVPERSVFNTSDSIDISGIRSREGIMVSTKAPQKGYDEDKPPHCENKPPHYNDECPRYTNAHPFTTPIPPAISSLPLPQSANKTAIIVGAGAGGVALAARLSKSGFSVTVIEKNAFTGGRCSLLHRSGYRFDVGPSLLLLLTYFNEIFHDLGLPSLSAAGVELIKCEPNYEVHFASGEKVTLSTDLAAMKEEVEKYEGPGGMERYLAFLKEAGRHCRVSGEHVLRRNFYGVGSLLRLGFLRYVRSLHPFESCWRRVRCYMKSEVMRRCLTFGCMYLGMSPYDAPGTYSLLQYTELVEGIWYPRGGFHQVIERLVQISHHFGTRYLLSTTVSKVLLDSTGTRATGVLLSTGATLTADVVILNSDLVHSYTSLLPPTRYSRSLQSRHHSCSSISFYWSLSHQIPALKAHNIFLATDYAGSFTSIFTHQQLPEEPSFYINVPSRIDSSAAPDGTDAVVVLVPTGHLTYSPGEETDISTTVSKARQWVLQTLHDRTGIDISTLIIDEVIHTPFTWRDKFNLTHGAILGLSHAFWNVLSFRPRIVHPELKGVFFVGASTHPGTGVPVCLAGAKLTEREVRRSCGLVEGEGWGELWRWGWVLAGVVVVVAVVMAAVRWGR
ncbi:phytoene desaturase [Ascodesmis nigricans]|uniref:Phytoene desaturase n=1 Tax=Ascodesmis nigricans TaxID=341454 RepID=A0A4S2MS44_9PEZI|nr:phytoene desaturase [Ascodesmis nigricans]